MGGGFTHTYSIGSRIEKVVLIFPLFYIHCIHDSTYKSMTTSSAYKHWPNRKCIYSKFIFFINLFSNNSLLYGAVLSGQLVCPEISFNRNGVVWLEPIKILIMYLSSEQSNRVSYKTKRVSNLCTHGRLHCVQYIQINPSFSSQF